MIDIIFGFMAGCLSALAPCVLPLLPVIIGGSFRNASRRRPYIIAASLALSISVFTYLLRATTSLIGIDIRVWEILSGGIVILLGLSMILPKYWELFMAKTGIQALLQRYLGKAGATKGDTVSAVLTGVALGPVFNSCSPLYAWVIASVVPSSPIRGMLIVGAYICGLVTILLLSSLLGKRFLDRAGLLSKPGGKLTIVIGCLFVLTGLLVFFGLQRDVQTFLVEKDLLNIKSIEKLFIRETL